MKTNVWVVVPAYNEATRLSATLRSLKAYAENVVVVDDGSADQTHSAALKEPVWVVRHAINCGQGAALQTGIDFALARGAEVIVTFDADGQHDPSEIAGMVEPILRDEADVVLGSRFRGQCIDLPWHRYLVLKLGVLFTRIVSGIAVSDTHNGFRALSAAAARQIRIRENRMAHASELLHEIEAKKLRWVERPVTIRYSLDSLAKGQSSWQAVGIATRFLLGRIVA